MEKTTNDDLSTTAIVAIYLLAVVIHCISFVFTLSLGIIPLFPVLNSAEVLQLYSPSVTATVCISISLLHFFGIFQSIYKAYILYTGKCSQKSTNSKKRSKNTLYSKVPFLRDFFDSRGKFGKFGKFYEDRLIFREIVEIPSASYQAYLLSYYATNPLVMISYAFLVFTNCFTLAITLNSKSIFIRRFGTLFCDTIYDFMFSVVFSLVLLFNQIIAIYIGNNQNLVSDKAWLTGVIFASRQVFVTSLDDLLTKTFPAVMSYLSVQGLLQFVNTKGLLKLSSIAISSPSTAIVVAKNKRKFKVLTFLGLVWGIALMCIAITASFSRIDCLQSCVVKVTPWFKNHCKCVVEKVNCKKLNLTTTHQLAQRLENSTSFDSLFMLEISQCNLPTGPDVKVLSMFKNLYGLHLYFNNLTAWDYDGHVLPGNLNVLEIIGSRFRDIPTVLLSKLPQSVRYLYFTNSSLSHVPDEAVVFWRHLYTIGFASSKFTEIPHAILQFKYLSKIYMPNNQITNLNISSSSNLTNLDLRFNRLTKVPDNLLEKLPKLSILNLAGNLISYFRIPFEKFDEITLNNNPVCYNNGSTFSSKDSKAQVLCAKNNCGSFCITKEIGDSICNIECNTKQCQSDGGDCDNYVQPIFPFDK